MEIVKRSMVATCSERRRMNRPSTEDFLGGETVLYVIIIVDSCHNVYLSKP